MHLPGDMPAIQLARSGKPNVTWGEEGEDTIPPHLGLNLTPFCPPAALLPLGATLSAPSGQMTGYSGGRVAQASLPMQLPVRCHERALEQNATSLASAVAALPSKSPL